MTSSGEFAVPFNITLKTSFILTGALLCMYPGAFVWVWMFELSGWVKLILMLILLGGVIIHSRRYVFKTSRTAVTGLIWQGQDQWQLNTGTGETVMAGLSGSTFVSPWLIVLNFRLDDGGRMLSVVLLPDTVDSTTFRRLCVKLKLYAGEFVST